jgi:hypothetical protein
MAGAINRDCLDTEYAAAGDQADAIAVLASLSDEVLALAFPAGDLIADLIDPDHAPLTAALGHQGPANTIPGKLQRPWQIANAEKFGHGDYLPKAPPDPAARAKWQEAADFVARAWRRQPQSWPA